MCFLSGISSDLGAQPKILLKLISFCFMFEIRLGLTLGIPSGASTVHNGAVLQFRATEPCTALHAAYAGPYAHVQMAPLILQCMGWTQSCWQHKESGAWAAGSTLN